MAEYAFSKGVVHIKRAATLKSGRWQPHALKPAFILLDAPPEREPETQIEEEPEGGGHDDGSEAR
jgi:hypothetical protein